VAVEEGTFGEASDWTRDDGRGCRKTFSTDAITEVSSSSPQPILKTSRYGDVGVEPKADIGQGGVIVASEWINVVDSKSKGNPSVQSDGELSTKPPLVLQDIATVDAFEGCLSQASEVSGFRSGSRNNGNRGINGDFLCETSDLRLRGS
jgi:hypothetical protein